MNCSIAFCYCYGFTCRNNREEAIINMVGIQLHMGCFCLDDGNNKWMPPKPPPHLHEFLTRCSILTKPKKLSMPSDYNVDNLLLYAKT